MRLRDIRGDWQIHQSNGFLVEITVPYLNLDGTFPVTAKHSNRTVMGSGFGRAGGVTVAGDEISFRLGWGNGTEGAYIGVFDGTGVIHGSTFDVQHPTATAGWSSDQSFGFVDV